VASLYFRARQAQGEAESEAAMDSIRQDEKRPASVSKATLAWFILPLLMLAFLVVFPFIGSRESLIESVRRGRYNA
ncbi:hypothetical protein WFJ45_22340, partial [Salmonella enterica subsp. enterica serovar Minnesota]|uniref:hypothetical protein n=1 Tax=Salmonella enterica TaxID=28901 RepID=UPI003D2E5814